MDLSQEDLAERAELHRTYVSTLERGLVNPTLETIEKVAAALEISISDLLTNYGVERGGNND